MLKAFAFSIFSVQPTKAIITETKAIRTAAAISPAQTFLTVASEISTVLVTVSVFSGFSGFSRLILGIFITLLRNGGHCPPFLY